MSQKAVLTFLRTWAQDNLSDTSFWGGWGPYGQVAVSTSVCSLRFLRQLPRERSFWTQKSEYLWSQVPHCAGFGVNFDTRAQIYASTSAPRLRFVRQLSRERSLLNTEIRIFLRRGVLSLRFMRQLPGQERTGVGFVQICASSSLWWAYKRIYLSILCLAVRTWYQTRELRRQL